MARCVSQPQLLALFLALFLPLASAADDLLILRKGKQRTGKLTVCSEELCRIGGSEVPLSEIVWIGIGQSSGAPPQVAPATVSIALLREGGEKRGPFLGLSLGVINIGDEDLERSDIAWIRLPDLTAGSADAPVDGDPAAGVDAVALRDGSVRVGELTACSGGSCYLEGSGSLSRREIVAIAFGAGDKGTGTSEAMTQDRIVLAGGGTRDGVVYGVSPEDVVAASGTYERSAVSAILFAPEPAAPGPDAFGAPGDAPAANAPPPAPTNQPPATPQPPSPPATTPPTGSPSPRAAPAPSQTGTRGRLWTGTMIGRIWGTEHDTLNDWNIRIDYKLREYLFPMIILARNDLKSMGTITRFASEGTVVSNSLRCTSRYGSCSGSGTATITGDLVVNPTAAEIFYRKTADPMTGYGFEVPQGSALYFVGVSAASSQTFDVTYRSLETYVSPSGFITLVGGRAPLIPPGEYSDPEYRYLVGGAMIGSYTRSTATGKQVAVSWAICPEGISCAAPELPEAPSDDRDPCARAGQPAAQRDTCRAQLDTMLEELGPALAEYNAFMAAAEPNREAFQTAQDFCAFYDKTKEILEAILTGGVGRAAEAARALMYLRDVIAKVQSGDLASMLYPAQVKKFLGYYKKAKAVWFELTASEIAKMQRDLGACSGKVPIETYLKAKKFVENLEAAKRVWDTKVAPGMNDLRTKGLECAYLDHAAWRACFQEAECRNEPPACGPEPSLEGAYDDP